MTYFQNIIVVGNAAVTFKVALLLQHHDVPVSVFVYEKKESKSFSIQSSCSKNSIPCGWGCKDKLYKTIMSKADSPLLVVSVVNRYLFPKDIIRHPFIKIVNYHNSILPQYKGVNAEAWQIFDMAENIGLTWHFVNDGIDEGDIIIQGTVPTDNTTTSIKLLRLQNILAYELFVKICEKLVNNKLTVAPQKTSKDAKVYLSSEIPNRGFLDLSWSFQKISAFLRAMDYGILNTLGKGKVIFEDKIYFWKRYMLNECKFETEKIVVIKENLVIQKYAGEIILCKITTAINTPPPPVKRSIYIIWLDTHIFVQTD